MAFTINVWLLQLLFSLVSSLVVVTSAQTVTVWFPWVLVQFEELKTAEPPAARDCTESWFTVPALELRQFALSTQNLTWKLLDWPVPVLFIAVEKFIGAPAETVVCGEMVTDWMTRSALF